MAENKPTNRERLREITDGIEQGIKELFESEKYMRYLSVMSRFHRYSVNNTMLIYMQKPDATLVAGYNKWKDQFERHVKKGEHGITIIAPTPYKKKIEEQKLDPDTKAPILDKDGKIVTEEKEIEIPMFRPVKVFDVSQTDGKPLPELASSLSGNVPNYEAFMEALRRSAPLKVALMLPMAVGNEPNGNYLEFYQGFLLGLDSVRTKYGHSIALTLYNTARNVDAIREIVKSDAFAGTGLIIGPVYEEGLHPVILYAEEHDVPVVSPLASITGMNSDALFQMAPDPSHKWDKVADLVNGDKQVTLIYSDSTDKDFESEILALLGDSDYRKYTYTYVHPSNRPANNPGDLTPLLDNGEDNVFVVMTDDEVEVERILAAIASADTSITGRGRTAPRFVVLGNTRWNRYGNLDRTVFFKDRVVFISTYHAKRDSQAILDFDRAYIRAFGALPSLYSYRGYDAALIFCPAMYNDIEYDMEGRSYTPLQTTYVFGQGEQRDNHVNRNWTRVNYNSDFTITIE